MDREGANIERLLTSGVGINAEGGEFLEIIKKMAFKENPGTKITVSILSLSWVIFYGMSLKQQWHWVSLDEVIETNVKKLEKRYPGGSFEIRRSEVRAAGDR